MDNMDLPKSLIFSKTISSVTGFTVRYLSTLEANNRFPRRIRLGARRIAWDASEVAKWQRGEWRPQVEEKKPAFSS